MKVLVIGSGGREHAIAWRLNQSERVSEVVVAPGNPGISEFGRCVQIGVDQIDQLVDFAKQEQIDLTVVGPEYPLTLGIVDRFEAEGLAVFGPRKEAARLEGSKSFAKEIMDRAGVPTAEYQSFTDFIAAREYLETKGAPIVLKMDGLAAGKGVFVCNTMEQAISALDTLQNEFRAQEIVIESFLSGVEASYIIATDGKRVIPLAASHDNKRIGENDTGPNTGGMGSVSPTPNLSPEQESWALENVMQPVIAELAKAGAPFKGFLYAGLMISPQGDINVLEFNVRLGDPETQVIMRRLDSDLFDLLFGLATGAEVELPKWKSESAVCVVLASRGYPQSSSKGDTITGVELTKSLPGSIVFHAGTRTAQDGSLETNGGRVLGVTAIGSDLAQARRGVYKACDMIQFAGMQLRRDI